MGEGFAKRVGWKNSQLRPPREELLFAFVRYRVRYFQALIEVMTDALVSFACHHYRILGFIACEGFPSLLEFPLTGNVNRELFA